MADKLRFEFIAQERVVYTADDVDMVIAPGQNGSLGVLPRHAPLMTIIVPGVLVVKKAGEEDRVFAVGGGFMEVRPDKVTLLARSGEAAEEIDISRAQEARRRAEEFLTQNLSSPEMRNQLAQDRMASMEQALTRSKVRLKVAERRRRARPSTPVPRKGGPEE
jgi:F-type H+-transporting ATPase subunit epsilon